MAKRYYGSAPAGVSNNETVDKSPRVLSASNSPASHAKEVPRVSDQNKNMAKLIILGTLILSIICLIAVYYVITIWYDGSNGAGAPDEAAASFVSAIDDNDDSVYSYLPRGIRDSGFMIDTMSISELKKLDEQYDIKLSHIVINSIDDLSDRIDSLESGLYSIYDTDVSISDAKKIVVTADLTYKLPSDAVVITANDETSDIELEDAHVATSEDSTPVYKAGVVFNLIVIQVNTKWYVYTGQQLSEDLDRTDADMVVMKDAESTNEKVYDIYYTKVSEIEKIVDPLEFYKGVEFDLRSGKISIDNVQYVIPVSYKSMINLVSLDLDDLDDGLRMLSPRAMLKHVPLSFVNDSYKLTDIDITIANLTDNDIDLIDGTIIGFYVGLPKDSIYDYPLIYLPGKITLGTSYSDVVKMYPHLTEFTNDNEDVKIYSKTARIYQIDIDGEKNRIYFEFDNDKLVAFQYYYSDLTNHN